MGNEIKGLIGGTALWIIGLFGMLIFWSSPWWVPLVFATVMLIGFAVNVILFIKFRIPDLTWFYNYAVYLWRTEYAKTNR